MKKAFLSRMDGNALVIIPNFIIDNLKYFISYAKMNVLKMSDKV